MTRLGFITDLHADVEALEVALAQMDPCGSERCGAQRSRTVASPSSGPASSTVMTSTVPAGKDTRSW